MSQTAATAPQWLCRCSKKDFFKVPGGSACHAGCVGPPEALSAYLPAAHNRSLLPSWPIVSWCVAKPGLCRKTRNGSRWQQEAVLSSRDICREGCGLHTPSRWTVLPRGTQTLSMMGRWSWRCYHHCSPSLKGRMQWFWFLWGGLQPPG